MFFRYFGRALCASSLVAGTILATSTIVSKPAHATGSFATQTCAGLDTGQGGTPFLKSGNDQGGVTVAEGDVLSFSGTGSLFFGRPTNSNDSAPLPAMFTVSAADAGTWDIQRGADTTISCTVAGSMSGSGTESGNLDQQQASLSTFLINHHAYTMTSGVGESVNGALNGGAAQNFLADSGFFFSTRGAANNRRQRFENLSAYTNTAPADPGDPLWNAWIKGRFTHYDGDNNSFDGHIADVFAGIDYQTSNHMVVGALLGYGRVDFDTVTAGIAGGFESDGVTIGAYTGIALGGSLTLDALVAYTASEYDNRSGAVTGSFDADRITFAAHLKGRHEYNDYTIIPILSFLWANEDQDAYIDSAAVAHASRSISAGRISIGPRVLFPEHTTESGYYRFWLGAMGEYDFSNQNTAPNSGLPDLGDVGSLRINGGVTSQMGEGTLNLRGDVFGIGSGEFTAVGGTISYDRPF